MSDKIHYTTGSVTPTVERIRGDTRIRVHLIFWLGLILAILSVGLVIVTFINTDAAKAYMPSMVPIISAAISGVAFYIVGRKTKGE